MPILRHHTECDFHRGLVIYMMQSYDDERDCHRGLYSHMLYCHLERWPYRPAKMSTSTRVVGFARTSVCMRVVIGLTYVPATPDLKIGSI